MSVDHVVGIFPSCDSYSGRDYLPKHMFHILISTDYFLLKFWQWIVYACTCIDSRWLNAFIVIIFDYHIIEIFILLLVTYTISYSSKVASVQVRYECQ